MSTRWYPIYQRGNPQLRVFLPNFWMKLIKPETIYGKGATVPKNKVQFIVSKEMTKYDIKNYLEKIYKVPVAGVKTVNKMGETYHNAFGGYLVKGEDFKIAFVTLPPGESFEWPDLKIKSVVADMEEGTKEDVDKAKEAYREQVGAESNKYRPGVPSFFGL